MPGLVQGIHDFICFRRVQVVDGRDEPGRDGRGGATKGSPRAPSPGAARRPRPTGER